MSETGGDGWPAVTRHVVRDLSLGGILCVMWTVVLCVSLHRADAEFLKSNWRTLYLTWLGMAGLWSISTLALGYASRKAVVPSAPPGYHHPPDAPKA